MSFKKVKIAHNQSIYDICIQEYGSGDYLNKILLDNPSIDLAINPPAGTEIKIDELFEPTSIQVVKELKSKGVNVTSKTENTLVSNLQPPSNVQATELTPGGNIEVTWDLSVSAGVINYKVYREVVLNSSRVLVATLGPAETSYTDTDTLAGLEHIYDIQAVTTSEETNVFDYATNAVSITLTANIAQPGLYFQDAYVEQLIYPSAKTFSGEFDIQVGIQGLSDTTGAIGLFGQNNTTNRVLLEYTTKKVKANIAGGGLLTSPVLASGLDLSGKKIIRIYRDASNDVYIEEGNSPAEYLFTKAGNFSMDRLFQTGGFGTTGHIWYLHDGDQEFLFEEGSGTTVTSTDGLVTLTIYSTQAQPHIDDNVWVDDLPLPSGYTEVQNLGIGGNYSHQILARMDTVDGINSHGHSHLVFMFGTNDIANGGTFVSVAQFQQNCEDIIQSALDAGSVPILCTIGTLDDAVKKSQKDYTSFYGPESEWNFNELVSGFPDSAIIPRYMNAMTTACSNKGIAPPIDLFNDIFIAQGTSPNYGELIGPDGTHWTGTAYEQCGETISDYLKTLTGVTSIGAVGDSLMYIQLATEIFNYYNAP